MYERMYDVKTVLLWYHSQEELKVIILFINITIETYETMATSKKYQGSNVVGLFLDLNHVKNLWEMIGRKVYASCR